MITLLLAVSRDDVASYVSALFTVFIILILLRILLGWVQMIRGSIPYNPAIRAVTGFLEETVDPYLNLFRRVIPPIGGGGVGLDLSPILAIIVLALLQGIVVSAIQP